jgi:hypothetical protein
MLKWLTENANATDAETFFESNPDKKAKDEPDPNKKTPPNYTEK